MSRWVYILLVVLMIPDRMLFAQKIAAKISPDLAKATPISINKTYSFQSSPSGFGDTQEFPVDEYRSNIYFTQERNTAWFSINIPFNGTLFFEIDPYSINDDYDWMLFKYTNTLKDELLNGKAKPLRSNNARNDKKQSSKTGLKNGYDNSYETPGVGKSFSKPLTVAKGDKLILVLDNIYDEGDGFDLKFSLSYDSESIATLEGVVTDKNTGNPLEAKISVEDDASGTFLAEVFSNKNGEYRIPIPMNISLHVIAQHPDHLFQTKDLTIKTENERADFLLDSITPGNKLTLYNIHFEPNKDIILPSSYPEIGRLIFFMRQNPQWAIKLVGHTNNNVFASPGYLQRLSLSRAVAIKTVLVQNSINDKRISCLGMGGKAPLVGADDPEAKTLNPRVEVVLEKIIR